jgi:hypothetical protein
VAQEGITLTVGSAATALDIFITAGQNGAPLDPTDIRFRIFDSAGVEAVTETAGVKRDVGVYTASGALIPTGFQLGDDWSIVWDITTATASGQSTELFCVADATLATSFANPAGNSIESIFDRVRIDIGDPDAMIFTDGLMRRALRKAVSRVNRRLGLVQVTQSTFYIWLIAFTSSRATPVITLDLQNGTVDPDTDPYVDILVLQMEEILLTGETVALQRLNQNTAGAFGSGLQGIAADGVSVTNADGVSISKAVGRLSHRADLAKFNLTNIREELERAIRDFRWRIAGGSGRDVTIPKFHHGGGYGGYGGGYGIR